MSEQAGIRVEVREHGPYDDIRTCQACGGRYLAPPGAYGRALEACRNCRHADLPPDWHRHSEAEYAAAFKARMAREAARKDAR